MSDPHIPYPRIPSLPPEDQARLLRNFEEVLAAIKHVPVGVSPNNGAFGDASDGVVTFDGSTTVLGLAPSGSEYTLTRDIYLAHGSAVNLGVKIKTRSYRVFCTGTLTLAGTIHANGLAPVGTTGGQSGGTGAAGASYYTTSNQDGGGGGGFGATGAKSGGGNISNAVGGTGGAGGSASAGGTGTGTVANNVTAPIASLGGMPRSIVHLELGATAPTVVKYEGGTGGTSGASAGSPAATGAGGGGGGICGVFAQTLINTGTLEAKGGDGGSASGASGNAGGGGGGGAGAIFVICGSSSVLGTTIVTGGVGGIGRGTGGTGGTGAAGNVFALVG